MSDFLRPNAAERQQLARKQQEKDAAVKRQRAEAAKERKKKRQIEAERIAQLDSATLARPKAPSIDNSPSAIARREVEAYLDSKPYFGHHQKANKEAVKAYCRGADGRSLAFDEAQFQFGTRDALAVCTLIRSGMWTPRGIHSANHRLMMEIIEEREAKTANAAEEACNAAREDDMAEQPTQVTEEQRQAAQLAAHLATDVPEADAESLARCNALGLCPATIDASPTWTELGPRAGISMAERVLRYVDLMTPGDPERDHASDLYKARRAKLVKMLNDRGRDGGWPFGSSFSLRDALEEIGSEA
jgi:hypothetical protein